jgi:2-methylisocitrate lyase-like PEP mutase family enzyme
MSTQNTLAQNFASLHTPSSPLVLTNVWDAITASSISSLPSTRALATASFAVAAAAGIADQDLDLETNLRAVRAIAPIAKKHNLPLTVDMQDGFGTQLEDGVRQIIEAGAVGMNLEDFSRESDGLYSIAEAADRIQRVVRVASELGVPDFVVNGRTDTLFSGGSLEDAIARGKAYLAAGAKCVFIWGGPARNGWAKAEVVRATKELEGRLNVSLARGKKDGLSVEELGEIGVSRISVGPYLMRWVAEKVGEEAERILGGIGA